MDVDLQIGDDAEITQTVTGKITDIRNGFLYLGGGDGDSIGAAVFRIADPALTIRKIDTAPPMPDWQPRDLIEIRDHTLLRTARNDWACTGMGCLNGHTNEAVSYEWDSGKVTILLKNIAEEDEPDEDPPTSPIPVASTVDTFPGEALPEQSGWVR